MNLPLTINDLRMFCNDEIRKGHGDYAIMISDDDEGNGYHYLWYAFTPVEEFDDDCVGIIEQIAPRNKTIILG